MVVFAYVGFKFMSELFKSSGRRFPIVFLILLAMLSSLALQVLSIVGAYGSVNYAKFSKILGTRNNNPKE